MQLSFVYVVCIGSLLNYKPRPVVTRKATRYIEADLLDFIASNQHHFSDSYHPFDNSMEAFLDGHQIIVYFKILYNRY